MRCAPERPMFVTIGVLILSFFVGPLLGLGLSQALAPGSQLAWMASTVAFAVAFLSGLLAWLGLGVSAVIFSGLGNFMRERIDASVKSGPADALVPPGYGAFVVLSVVSAGFAGVVVGIASDTSLLAVVGLYGFVGVGYGLALWLLAHHGYLPFPEPQ